MLDRANRLSLTFFASTLILGAIFGASTAAAGISPLAAIFMYAVVWSGAGQFAASWRQARS
jgi:predicted branched-subunit amino acid permease